MPIPPFRARDSARGSPITLLVTPTVEPLSARARGYFAWKRCIDLLIGSLILFIVLPLALLCAIAIKLDTGGPILFAQHRVGTRRRCQNGRIQWEVRTFRFYKFRSMVPGAGSSLHSDSRLTRVGRVLRRTSLDELPQLLNVLKGDMSLVGPRPFSFDEVAAYLYEFEVERLTALPGITGLRQVSGGADVSFAEMMRMDIEYVRNQSLWLDLKILGATIPAVWTRRGAK